MATTNHKQPSNVGRVWAWNERGVYVYGMWDVSGSAWKVVACYHQPAVDMTTPLTVSRLTAAHEETDRRPL